MYLYILLFTCALFLWLQNVRRSRSKAVDALIKQSARLATTAQQDEAPMHAVMHANSAVAYMNAAKELASDTEIYEATGGVRMSEFKERILGVQDMVTRKTIAKCPQFAGEVDLYLNSIAG